MNIEQGLTQIEELSNIAATPVVEMYRFPQENEYFDVDTDWYKDQEGSGLILYLYQGNRHWIRASVSKTPFSFLEKSLAKESSSYLVNALLIRGTEDYPLTDKEIKNLAALLNSRLKNTPTALFSSYITFTKETDESETILNNTLADIVQKLEELGFDVAKRKPEPSVSANVEDLQSAQTEIIVNGLTVAVTTKLVDDNDPHAGIKYASVKLTDPTGTSLVYASTGSLNTLTEDEDTSE